MSVCIHIYTCIYIHVYTHTYIHICIYVCIYIYRYIYICLFCRLFFADTRFSFINAYRHTPQLATVAYRRQAFADKQGSFVHFCSDSLAYISLQKSV